MDRMICQEEFSCTEALSVENRDIITGQLGFALARGRFVICGFLIIFFFQAKLCFNAGGRATAMFSHTRVFGSLSVSAWSAALAITQLKIQGYFAC